MMGLFSRKSFWQRNKDQQEQQRWKFLFCMILCLKVYTTISHKCSGTGVKAPVDAYLKTAIDVANLWIITTVVGKCD